MKIEVDLIVLYCIPDKCLVYRCQSKDAGNSDSEAEQEQLDELEMILREHDPEFVE